MNKEYRIGSFLVQEITCPNTENVVKLDLHYMNRMSHVTVEHLNGSYIIKAYQIEAHPLEETP